MPRNLGFYDRKMNWTFLFILVQVHSISELSSVQVLSAKKWTEFSSKFTKKVNFWTELNFSVQFSHFLDHQIDQTVRLKMKISPVQLDYLNPFVFGIHFFPNPKFWFRVPDPSLSIQHRYAKEGMVLKGASRSIMSLWYTWLSCELFLSKQF